ncbi:hypothetical protein SELMODRAFT_83339 [Selaginella moellendorffii]|uniref:DYW domain-containing protein n=1 Tax=Selaginella moellendorffii TaxID=88036 RepID=D8R2S2_SELML|nr:hypothetical protein SELMODRAFT_83339 [Selaginella moellendorffii]
MLKKHTIWKTKKPTIATTRKNACSSSSSSRKHDPLDSLEREIQSDSFAAAIRSCKDSNSVSIIHQKITRAGLGSSAYLNNLLVLMLAKHGSLCEARSIFDAIQHKNIFSWNIIISAYAHRGHPSTALHLFAKMDVPPTAMTFATALSACSSLGDLQRGREIHARIKASRGIRPSVILDTAIFSMYAKCGDLSTAKSVFDRIPAKNVVSWNALIAAYAQSGHSHHQALDLFEKMAEHGVRPCRATFVGVLGACNDVTSLEKIHARIVETGLQFDVRDVGVQNALLNMYAKCGSLEVARDIFRKMQRRDQVSMNVMIATFAQQGLGKESIQVFREMDLEGLPQDDTTFASVITACSCCGALEFGKRIHKRVVEPVLGRKCCLPNVVVETALVSMYGKCGTLEQAKAVFKAMTTKNSVSWNAMLAACAHQGQGDEAAAFLRAAACEGVELDSASFISVLIACSHSGMLEVAYDHFQLMLSDFDLVPAAENYRCMVDLLARSGRLGDADELMNSMPFSPDAIAWRTLLGGCRVQGSLENAASAAEQAFNLEPQNTAPYTLLSSLYSATGKKDELVELRSSMKERGLRKLVPGRSVIEVHGRVHEFVAGDSSHPQIDKILRELDILNVELKQAGFVPSTDGVVHDLKTEDKEEILALHSEKLAVAFGLISTKSGIPLLVLKNLRVCSDCHGAIKLISKLRSRVITVRDANRFHRFQSGTCSCGDYW